MQRDREQLDHLSKLQGSGDDVRVQVEPEVERNPIDVADSIECDYRFGGVATFNLRSIRAQTAGNRVDHHGAKPMTRQHDSAPALTC